MNIPQVGCPPAADEATLQRLPAPFACGRDNSLPSLEPAFLAHYRNTSMVPSAKMQALVGILESTLSSDPSAKFVVFSQFPFTTVKPCLDQHGFACVSVTAQCKMADRQQAVGAFSSDPDVKVILVGMGVGAAGLTLTAASTLILLEPSHNLGDEAQAMSRIHRIGQAASSVEIFVLFTPRTVEERMLKVRQDQGHAFLQCGDDSAALSVTSGGDKGSHFSLASFQAFLGLGEAVDEEE
jgi:SNF2 family DNA or RNA helicase